MENTVKDRIVAFLRYSGIPVGTFERRCRLSNGYVRSLKNEPSVSKMESILKEYPEINKNWLLTGEGEMLNSSSVSQHVENSNNVSLYGDANSCSDVNINKFLEELASQRKTLEKSQEQLSVAQEQINRLISLLEKR
jgi:hypothetical protein